MSPTSNRPARVGAEIQRTLAGLLLRGGLNDPRIGMITFTGCEVTADLREARVYWTSHGSEQQLKASTAGLEAAKGFLRREVGKVLGLRVTPDLRFTYDEAIDRGQRVEELLREVKKQDEARAERTDEGEGQ
jgi:ribosome-binding factor A